MRRLALVVGFTAVLAVAEPALRDHAARDPDVFFFESFENGEFPSRFHGTAHPENLDLVADAGTVLDGERSLRVTFREGKHGGAALRYVFRKAGRKEPEELYGRYYLRFDADWDPGKGGKLPGPAGTYGKAGWGGRKSNGRNGWSARMGFSRVKGRPDLTQLHYYVYYPGSGQWGGVFYWKIDRLGQLERERWYCIETYVKLNTPGETNGVLRGWVDGKLAFEKVNLRFRDVPELRVEHFWIDLYYGGSTPAPREMHVYLDNVALSTKPIGPFDRAK